MIPRDNSQDGESLKSKSSRNDHNVTAVEDRKMANMAAYPSTKDDDLEQAIIVESERQTSPEAEASTPDNDDDTSPSVTDIAPPPDGGLTAWTQCLCAHLTNVTTFGYITSYGSFQTHYESTLLTASGAPVPPSTIAWIGSVQLFLTFLIGAYSGRALDSGHFRHLHAVGSVLHVIGIFSTAQCTTVWWQVFLAQALCSGVAHGLMYCPAMALVTTYFARRRALAVGLAALGSCTGGVVFPVLMRELLPRVGFAWTVRVIGFVVLGCDVLAGVLFRVRLAPRRAAPWVDWGAFREGPYVLFCAGMFCNFWGLFFTFFYVGSYARNILHVSYEDSINLLLTVVGAGFICRLLPNYIADRLGTLNVLIPFAYLCGIMMFGWIGVHSLAALFVFAGIYGCGSAGIQALWPAVFNGLMEKPDLQRAGVRMGMAFTVVSWACLTGPPLAGALIQRHDGGYLYAQIWGGTSFFLGGSLLVATRIAKVGWRLKAKI